MTIVSVAKEPSFALLFDCLLRQITFSIAAAALFSE